MPSDCPVRLIVNIPEGGAVHVGMSWETAKRLRDSLQRRFDIRDKRDEYLAIPIEELEVSVRLYTCLKNAEFYGLAPLETVSDITRQTEAELLKTKNLGRRSVIEIKDVLGEMGLALAESKDGD